MSLHETGKASPDTVEDSDCHTSPEDVLVSAVIEQTSVQGQTEDSHRPEESLEEMTEQSIKTVTIVVEGSAEGHEQEESSPFEDDSTGAEEQVFETLLEQVSNGEDSSESHTGEEFNSLGENSVESVSETAELQKGENPEEMECRRVKSVIVLDSEQITEEYDSNQDHPEKESESYADEKEGKDKRDETADQPAKMEETVPETVTCQNEETPDEQDQEEQIVKTVAVVVPENAKLQDADVYRYYFDNPRNGGGEVEAVEKDEERTVYVTFKEPAVAQRVANREHTICGQLVTVELHVPRPCYLDELLFRNVPDNTSREHISNFMELISGMPPTEILYGDEPGVVLATFDRKPDFSEVEQQCQKTKLQGDQLTVERVPISNCLLVEDDLDPDERLILAQIFEDVFRLERSKLSIDGETPKLLLYFEDHKDLKRAIVHAKTNNVGHRKLHLRIFFECLGLSGGVADPNSFAMPRPVMAEKVMDNLRIGFLCSSEIAFDLFSENLCHIHAWPKIVNKTIEIECTLTPEVPQARMIAKRWTEVVKRNTVSFSALVDIHTVRVSEEIWSEAVETVAGAVLSGQDLARLFVSEKKKVFYVVGMEVAAKTLVREIQETVTAVEAEASRRKEVVMVPVQLKQYQMCLLEGGTFLTWVGKQYLGITVQPEGRNVIFHGLLPQVLEAKSAMYDLLSKEKSHKFTSLSERKRKLLATAETTRCIMSKLKNERVNAAWDFNGKGEVIIYALDEEDPLEAADIIDDSIVELDVTLEDRSVSLVETPEWQNLVETLTLNHLGKILIRTSLDQISLVGTDDIALDCKKAVNKFIKNSTIFSKEVSFSQSRQKIIVLYMSQELTAISKDLADYKVKISVSDSGTTITIEGTEKGILMAEQKLEKLGARIVSHEENLVKQSKLKFLVSEKNKRDVNALTTSNQCVISFTPETPGLQQSNGRDKDATEEPTEAKEDAAATRASTSTSASELTHESAPLPTPAETLAETPAPTPVLPEVLTSAPQDVRSGCVIKLDIVEGEIAQERVDVIVNTTADSLELNNGAVSASILRAAGPALQQECKMKYPKGIKSRDIARTKGHNMACREIYHVALCHWSNGTAEQDLRQVMMKCLTEASNNQHASIAFPALGTGNLNYPRNTVACAMFDVVRQFEQTMPTSSLRSVRIVVYHQDKQTIQAFRQMELQTRGASMPAAISGPYPTLTSSTGTRKSKRKAQAPTAPSAMAPTQHSTPAMAPLSTTALASPGRKPATADVIRVSIVEGEIAQQKVDIIVNTTSTCLDLNKGAVSSSVLKAAGRALQDECKQRYPQGISDGGIARTSGHNLSCREVFHVALPQWSPAAQQRLEQVILNCLTMASTNRNKTIAFPALGTGNLKYPPEQVAQTMFDLLRQFVEQAGSTTSLRDVRIVVYPKDTTTIKAFRKVQQTRRVPGSDEDTETAVEMADSELTPPSRTNADAVDVFDDVYGMQLVVCTGEMCDQDVDAIVNITDDTLDLRHNAVARSLRSRCGEEMEAELRKRVNDMQQNGIAVTKAYSLQSSYILHVNAERFLSKSLETAYRVCLEEAERYKAQLVAVPAMGTGAFGLTAAESSKALLSAMKKLSNRKMHLCSVYVVIDCKTITLPFVEGIRATLKEEEGSAFGRMVKKAWKLTQGATSSSLDDQKTLNHARYPAEPKIFVYAASADKVQNFLGAFEDLFGEKFKEDAIQDDILQTMDSREIQRIKDIAQRHDVEVQIHAEACRVFLQGQTLDVFEAHKEVTEFLRAKEREHQEKRMAAMIANMVQWCVLEITSTDSEQVEYPSEINKTIETAYQEKKKTVEFKDRDGVSYVIDFDKMQEYKKENPTDVVTVIRREKIKDTDAAQYQLPVTWTPNIKEFNMVPLQSTSCEFREVEANFRATLGGIRVTVTQMARIENPLLYRQYSAKKAHMQIQNQGHQNERTLWHGTAGDATENINRHGFNRSYCGKNATYYGEGVYFAVNSSYSADATYSPRDSAGNRYMYQCKVLVGYSTKGARTMRFLPLRNKTTMTMYDSATENPNNPGIFVIFNDTQAYPEYLITFK